MNLCEDGHDEVVYTSKECPACLEIEARKEVESEAEGMEEYLRDKIQSLEQQLSEST